MKIRIIIFIVPVVLLSLALAGGSSLLLRFFFVSILVPLAAYLWTVFGVRGISVQAMESPTHCQVGEQFEQEIEIFNKSRMPKIWLKVEGNIDMPGPHSATILNLLPRSYYSWQTNVYCQRRGRHQVGTVVATTTDFFGLFSRQRKLGRGHSILVYPATFDLPLFKLTSFSDFGRGSSYQSFSQLSTNASTVREFATGDSLHHIHWPSTAHTGKLMVKVFDADRSYGGSKTIWVVVDMEAVPQAGQDDETTEEYGITVAASLVRKYIDSGMRVGAMASGDGNLIFQPERGEDHLWRILEGLAVIKAAGHIPMGQLIYEQMGQFRDNASVIIITPSVTGHLLDVIRQLRSRVDAVAVVLLDAASFGGAVTTVDQAHNLNLLGVKVFIVRRGDDLARVLNERLSLARATNI